MGMYRWFLTPRFVSEGQLSQSKYSTVPVLKIYLLGRRYNALPVSDHFDKGTPLFFFVKMFIFVLVPRNLIMSKVQREIIFDHSSHILFIAVFSHFVCNSNKKIRRRNDH